MNDLTAYLASFAAIAAAVWAAIHGLQKMTPLGDRAVALIVALFGIAGGVVAQGSGFVTTPAGPPWSWIACGFFGLLAALAGAGATDLNLVRPTPPGGTS
jgi:4-hydroxybenzoate polyprenyltransferase